MSDGSTLSTQLSDATRFMGLFVGGDHAHGILDTSITDKPVTRTVPVGATEQDYRDHLSGKLGLGLVPIRRNGTCRFGAIDLDSKKNPLGLAQLQNLARLVADQKLPLHVCRSKSGGAHLYLFVREPGLEAQKLRQVLRRWVSVLNLPLETEIFPKQDELKDGDLGSWINLAFFNVAATERYGVTSDGKQNLTQFLDSIDQVDPAKLAESWREAPPGSALVTKPAPGRSVPPRRLTLTQAKRCRDRFLDLLSRSREGERNTNLNSVAFELGRLANFFPRDERERWLEAAAAKLGLPAGEQAATIRSGLNAGEQDPYALRQLRLKRDTPADVRRVTWRWPAGSTGYLARGSLHIMFGEPGEGKTTLMAYIASIITSGGTWPDGTRAERGSVVIGTVDDSSEEVLDPKILLAGGDLSRVEYIEIWNPEDGSVFALPRDLDLIEDVMERSRDRPAVIFLDSPESFFEGADFHNAQEVKRALAPLCALAKKTGVAIFLLMHPRKNADAEHPLHQISGSLAFAAAARLVFWCVDDPRRSDRYVFLPIKNNLGKLAPALEYEIEEKLIDIQGVPTPHGWIKFFKSGYTLKSFTRERATPEQDRAEEWLVERLRGGGWVSSSELETEVMKRGGFSWMSVRRARKRLGAEVEVKKFANDWRWRLRPEQLSFPEGEVETDEDRTI